MLKLIKTKSFLIAILFTFSTLGQAVVTNIDFDIDPTGAAINAPNLFSGATPLTDLYSGSGVNFSALERTQITSEIPVNGVLTTLTRNELTLSGSGMGAILDESSGFSGAAKSGDNFLAFNGETDFSSHFWRISFDNPIGYFSIDKKIGANVIDGDANFDAYDIDGNLIGSINYEYVFNAYSQTAFQSETEISYIDIGHGLECCDGGNASSSLQPTPWALVYDDLVFGELSDAPEFTPSLTGGDAFVPVPGSVWLLLTGLFGLITKRRLTNP